MDVQLRIPPNSANLPDLEGQVPGVPRDLVGAGRSEKNRALYPRGWLLLAVATNVAAGHGIAVI